MKKTLLFAFFLLAAAICFGQDNSPNVGFQAAWKHCASTTSYWAWIGITVVVSGAVVGYLTYRGKTQENNRIMIIVVTFLIAGAILASILALPCDMAVNTSVDAAARGNWIR